jgi:hypothetical protein
MLLGQPLVASDNKAIPTAITILLAAVEREAEAPLGYSRAKRVTRNTCDRKYM